MIRVQRIIVQIETQQLSKRFKQKKFKTKRLKSRATDFDSNVIFDFLFFRPNRLRLYDFMKLKMSKHNTSF